MPEEHPAGQNMFTVYCAGTKSNVWNQSITEEGKKFFILQELGNKKQLGVWEQGSGGLGIKQTLSVSNEKLLFIV